MGSAVLQLHVRRGPPHDDGVARARARVELATLTLAVARARCRACARLRAHTAFWPLQVANKSAQRRLSKCTRRQRKRCRNGRHSIDKEKEEEAEDKISYLQKAKTLYFTPVSFILLVACALQAFCHYSITIWSPVIAATRFAGKDLSEVNFALTVGVLLSILLALAVNGVLLAKSGHLKQAIRIGLVMIGVAVACLYAMALLENFYAYIVLLIAYLITIRFAYLYKAQLPYTLGFDPVVAAYAVSRFALAYSVFGDIVGAFTTGFILERTSPATTLYILAAVASAALLCWAVVAVWSCASAGFVHERDIEQKRERARKNWSVLRDGVTQRIRLVHLVAAFNPGQHCAELDHLMQGRFDKNGNFILAQDPNEKWYKKILPK